MSVSELDRWDYNKREVLHNESPNISDAEWEPADPLVVYSNIRNLIKENEKLRDQIRKESTELLEALEKCLDVLPLGEEYDLACLIIAKAKGEQA